MVSEALVMAVSALTACTVSQLLPLPRMLVPVCTGCALSFDLMHATDSTHVHSMTLRKHS